MMKGLITLDIDGTLTADSHSIPAEVVEFLARLAFEGWKICLITGRAIRFANSIFEQIPFPFLAAVHNGALIMQMPERKVLRKRYLSMDLLPHIEEICLRESTDFLIYAGIENNSECYYRPERHSEKLLAYLVDRAEMSLESLVAVDRFDTLPIDQYVAFKCFGAMKPLLRIAGEAENLLSVHCPVIRDPFTSDMYIAQATHGDVSKGHAVRDLKDILEWNGPVIAAGDDLNDISLLKAADFKIAMEGSPATLIEIADYLAPSAAEMGIIPALEKGIDWIKRSKI